MTDLPETHARFRAAVEAHDHDAMEACLAPDVVFRSPAVHTPYEGREATMQVLRAVTTVFEDFTYVDELAGQDGTSVLVFTTRVGDRQLQGIDLLRFGDDGLVSELTVMVRPLKGVVALVEAMGAALAEQA